MIFLGIKQVEIELQELERPWKSSLEQGQRGHKSPVRNKTRGHENPVRNKAREAREAQLGARPERP